MKEFLEYILSKIIGKDREASIDFVEDDSQIMITITLPEGSHGVVIGRGGKTINSIKTLLRLYQIKHNLPEKLLLLNIA